MSATPGDPLHGRTVLVTRQHRGELDDLLEARGATAVHVPLIEIVPPADGGDALRVELADLGSYDWLVVTSGAGAARVGAAAAGHPEVRLAAVGESTARTLADLAGRPVDLVPTEQRAAGLAAALLGVAATPSRMLLALAERAGDEMPAALAAAGHDVRVVTAYRTAPATPDPALVEGADALLLASGSAAEAWVATFGPAAPPVVVAIGPTTAETARRSGLKVTGIAADHSLTGLVDEVASRITDVFG